MHCRDNEHDFKIVDYYNTLSERESTKNLSIDDKKYYQSIDIYLVCIDCGKITNKVIEGYAKDKNAVIKILKNDKNN